MGWSMVIGHLSLVLGTLFLVLCSWFLVLGSWYFVLCSLCSVNYRILTTRLSYSHLTHISYPISHISSSQLLHLISHLSHLNVSTTPLLRAISDCGLSISDFALLCIERISNI